MPNAAPTAENFALAAVPELAIELRDPSTLAHHRSDDSDAAEPPPTRLLYIRSSCGIDTVVGTSANPCAIKSGVNVEVTFPLLKTKCLLYSFRPVLAEFDVHEAIVDIVNARTAVCALREVYAPPAATEADKERQLRSLRLETNPFESLSTRMPNAAGAPIDPTLLLLQAAASLRNDAE